MIRFVCFLVVLLSFSLSLHSAEGEIILDNSSINIDGLVKQKKTQKPKMATTAKALSKSEKKNIESEIKELKSLLKKLVAKLEQKEKNRVQNIAERKAIFSKRALQDTKLRPIIVSLLLKLTKLIDSKLESPTKAPMISSVSRNKKPSKLKILSIIVGKDSKEQLKDKGLPIVITILSPSMLREGNLKVYAKSLSTDKEYLIYKIDPIKLNRRWAQDQMVWTGTYIDANDKELKLEKGKYRIYSVLEAGSKVITRFWGKTNKSYYVSIL